MALVVGRGVPEVVQLSLLRGQAWVAGSWVNAVSRNTYPVFNPANGGLIADVSLTVSRKGEILNFSTTRSQIWVQRMLLLLLMLHTRHNVTGLHSPARYRELLGSYQLFFHEKNTCTLVGQAFMCANNYMCMYIRICIQE